MRLTQNLRKKITLQIEHLCVLLKKKVPLVLLTIEEYKTWRERQKKYFNSLYGDKEIQDCYGLCHLEERDMIFINVAKNENWKTCDDTIRHEILHLTKNYAHYTPAFNAAMKKLKDENNIKNGRIIKAKK